MFDLHMHTTLSDGALSVDELLDRLKSLNINCISITDHNHSLAYSHINDRTLNIITGVELASSFQGNIIEVLGYDVDVDVINHWYHTFYSSENLEKNERHLFKDLKDKARELGFEIPDTLSLPNIEKGISKKTIYSYLSERYDVFEFPTYKTFFRMGLSNPSSPWFVDEGRFYPSLQETINLIHKAQGIAILAHPHEYGLSNLNELYEYAVSLGLDGIESYHPSASMMQSNAIVKYCVDHNLKSSGGSDFHRDARGIPHGVHMHKDILANPCFDWFRKRL